MPTLEELTAMVEQAGGDPQKLTDAMKAAIGELTGAQKALHDANKEAADRRKRLEALEAEDAKRKQDAMSETEKLTAAQKAAEERAQKAEQDKAAAEAKAQETLMRSMVMLAAGNFNDPRDAWTFIDRSKVTINDAGDVVGIEKAIEELAKSKPYLLKSGAQPQPDKRPNGTPPPRGAQGGNKPKPEELPVQRISY